MIGNSDHPDHTVLARRSQQYLRWRNANARHPDVLAAQRRGRPRPEAAGSNPAKVCGQRTSGW
ncbi:hypothetical protein GCM10010177_04590 [Actinomadura citrea]|nr:hypothetical protein GCM10010177_04590 [Actinomadura citrea]